MTAPINPPQVVTNPLQWQVGHGTTPDGTKICVLTLLQGMLNAAVQLSPEDTERLGRSLLDVASQARTGLIIPSGIVASSNNGHQNGAPPHVQ